MKCTVQRPRVEHRPENCKDCGEPLNDADAPASGLCLACAADDTDEGLAADQAARDELRDWENSRGVDRFAFTGQMRAVPTSRATSVGTGGSDAGSLAHNAGTTGGLR